MKKDKTEYHFYLQSDQWKGIRSQVINRDKGVCQICKEETLLPQVHHLTYKNIFNEKLEDLITICDNCHREIHNKQKKNPIYSISAGRVIQLKKLLEVGFNHSESSLISEIIYFCKSKEFVRKRITNKSTNSSKTFQDSIETSTRTMKENLKTITSGNCPPILKEKGKINKYSVNLSYFDTLYKTKHKSVSEILNHNKLSQDRFLCYLYGWKPTIVLSQFLYWDKTKNKEEIINYKKREFGKQIFLSKNTISSNIDKLTSLSTPPIKNNGEARIGSEIEFFFENIKKHQIIGLENLKMMGKYEYYLTQGIPVKLNLITAYKKGIIV